ncbi:MAG: SDR family NAD(P)-dependent oxidoreductase [Nanoarchaeota archaeon]|nr:SDR family NAD(P)-dependent oxidoreductase [Nanoarchaeota archaeon]
MKILVTGAGGLIGSETCRFYLERGAKVRGVDNNMRKYFFGKGGDTSNNISALKKEYKKFSNQAIDIRNRDAILNLFKNHGPFDLIIHTAAQPSHDWAAREPFTDFDVNANGTLNLLEAFRQHSPKGVFIFTSTNKVYGDNPNNAALIETKTRYDYAPKQTLLGVSSKGIDEQMSLDRCKHSLFGASKAAADIMVQEYGKYFGLKTGVFRGGCLTGPQHSAVELHGFLTYIVDCAFKKKPYKIFGYKGKQVRDHIHSIDVVRAFDCFFKNPKNGEVYNIGGTKQNSASILEVIEILKKDFGLELNYKYAGQNRIGDHICYYTNMSKFMKDYPGWKRTKSLKEIIREIVEKKRKN